MSPNRPKYNDWTVIRRIDVGRFASDPDWVSMQDGQLRDAHGVTTLPFSVPNLPGRTASGFALLLVGVDGNGEPVDPQGMRAHVELLEIVRHDGSSHGAHVCRLEDFDDELEPWSFVLPANLTKPIRGVGGAQNQYAVRVTTVTPGNAHEARLLVKPLGG